MIIKTTFVGLLLVLAILLAGCAQSAAQTPAPVAANAEPFSTFPEWISPGLLRQEGRPKNGYAFGALSTDRGEQKVCRRVLNSLNSARPPQASFELADSMLGYADAVLGNDYSVEWTYFETGERQHFGRKGNGPSRAVVDIDNDGDLDTIYRDVRMWKASLFTDVIGYQGSPPVVEPPLNLTRVSEIVSIHKDDPSAESGGIFSVGVQLDQSSIPEGRRIPVELNYFGLRIGQFVDVLRIKRFTYILRGGSIDAGIQGHAVPIRLYRAKSYQVHKLLCEFVAVNPAP